MKEMTAKEYLKAVSRICNFEEAAGRCRPKDSEGKVCPLADYECGTPKEPETIKEVLELVGNYKMPPKGACLNCGSDILELRKTKDIRFCPFCGADLSQQDGDS